MIYFQSFKNGWNHSCSRLIQNRKQSRFGPGTTVHQSLHEGVSVTRAQHSVRADLLSLVIMHLGKPGLPGPGPRPCHGVDAHLLRARCPQRAVCNCAKHPKAQLGKNQCSSWVTPRALFLEPKDLGCGLGMKISEEQRTEKNSPPPQMVGDSQQPLWASED